MLQDAESLTNPEISSKSTKMLFNAGEISD